MIRTLTAASLVALDDARRDHVGKLQDAQTRRNAASKEIGAAMASGDADLAEKLKSEVAEIKQFIQSGDDEGRRILSELETTVSGIPNLPLDDVRVVPDRALPAVRLKEVSDALRALGAKRVYVVTERGLQ